MTKKRNNKILELLGIVRDRKRHNKEMFCYHCEKTKGIARPVIKKYYHTEKKEKLEVKTWEAKGFKMLSPDLWLCKKCNEFRCKKCHILLSNTFKCDRCYDSHGSYTGKSLERGLCAECFRGDKIKIRFDPSWLYDPNISTI